MPLSSEDVLKKIKLIKIPKHLAIIMDGNGRWATSKGFSRMRGHRVGAENAIEIAKHCNNLGVKYLTLYAFSSENWNRPAIEIAGIMTLLNRYLGEKNEILSKHQVKFLTIGTMNKLPKYIQEAIRKLKKKTKNFKKLSLILALSYGSRDEITRAVRNITKDFINGKIKSFNINEDLISNYLDTKGIPDPDLFIRTGGNWRLSNFLLWQSSYSELFITNKYWPEFSKKDLEKALIEYGNLDKCNYSRTCEYTIN